MYLHNYLMPEMAIIARPKLTGLGEHWGVQLPDQTVAHNTQERGVHMVRFEEFEAGKPVRLIRRIPVSEHQAVFWRVHQELASQKAYHPLENNCEMFANRVTGDEPRSPQVLFWAFVAGLGFVALATRA